MGKKILGISGSLRRGSSNTALLSVAMKLAPFSVSFELFENLGGLPYFNPDFDGANLPKAVENFRHRVIASDAILISTPEYAHGVPGILKNSLDWLVGEPKFAGKAMGIICGSATEGSFALNALIEVLQTMSAKVIPEAVVSISGIRAKFDRDGNLSDPNTIQKIQGVMNVLGK